MDGLIISTTFEHSSLTTSKYGKSCFENMQCLNVLGNSLV